MYSIWWLHYPTSDWPEMLDRRSEVCLAKSKAKPPLSSAVIARNFGVSKSSVCAWFQKGCPRTTIDAVSQWRAANMRSERQPLNQRLGGGPIDPNAPRELTLAEKRTMADTRKIDSDVALRRLRLAEKRGDLVSHREVERELAELVVRIKERLLAAPEEFYTRWPESVRDQCKADFIEFLRQLLLEVSRWKILGVSMDDCIIAAGNKLEEERNATTHQ